MKNPTTTHPPALDTRIHVLQVVGNAIVGGMERWVERLVQHLPPARFRVSVACPFEGAFADRLRALGCDVQVVPMPEDMPWSSVQALLAVVRATAVDLLHAHLPNAHVLAGLAGRLAGRPVLATIHGRTLSMADLEVHRTVGSHISVVCRQSHFHALAVGVDPALLSCEPNGVDTDQFCPGPRGGLRAALGLADDVPLVGQVGRLSPEKGPEVFVRAALLLHSLRQQAHLVLVGDGPMEAQVRRMLADHGLAGQVHLPGLLDDMPALYRELDVLVSSSHSEAMPLALMEGMASGLPVVATRVGGVPDMVAHGQTGWLVAPGDFQDIASRCNGLLGDAALRRRMGAQARERAVQRMALDASVARAAALLQRLARKPVAVAGMAAGPAGPAGPAVSAVAAVSAVPAPVAAAPLTPAQSRSA
jgi:glycosyltransferase involved in cell wall biosynthesis